MDDSENKKEKTVSKKSSHVRFTDSELAQIERDELVRGVSIPVLLKEAYFGGRPTMILMSQEDQKAVLTELRHQGNNLNQIAKKVNAGISSGMWQELGSIRRAICGIMTLLNGKKLHAKAGL